MPKVGYVIDIGEKSRWAEIRDHATRAEQAGFDSVWLFDHFIMRNKDGVSGQWECWSLVSALAAATSRIQIGTLVVCTGFRNPALLAKMADTVDEVSGGRLILGLGAGWHEPEYIAFGYPFDHRVSRFEEALQIICPLLREGRVDFEGRFYQARECELRPRGPSAKGPPILVAAFGERMLRLTAQHADLWNGAWYRSPDDAVKPVAQIDAACSDVGRDPKALGRTAGIRIDTADGFADLARAYAAQGFEHVILRTDASIESFAPALETLGRG